MKITKEELKNKYGIELPKGQFSVKKVGDAYEVYSVKDDTQGCVILGENKVKGQVINSRATCEKVFARMYDAYLRNEPIFLTIR